MKECNLTQREKQLICRISSDLQTGNHLLFERGQEYWDFGKEFSEAYAAEVPTDRQKQIVEYYRQCSDYSYWNSLPDDEKFF